MKNADTRFAWLPPITPGPATAAALPKQPPPPPLRPQSTLNQALTTATCKDGQSPLLSLPLGCPSKGVALPAPVPSPAYRTHKTSRPAPARTMSPTGGLGGEKQTDCENKHPSLPGTPRSHTEEKGGTHSENKLKRGAWTLRQGPKRSGRATATRPTLTCADSRPCGPGARGR